MTHVYKTKNPQEGLLTENPRYEYVLVEQAHKLLLIVVATRLTVQQDEANWPSQLAWV